MGGGALCVCNIQRTETDFMSRYKSAGKVAGCLTSRFTFPAGEIRFVYPRVQITRGN